MAAMIGRIMIASTTLVANSEPIGASKLLLGAENNGIQPNAVFRNFSTPTRCFTRTSAPHSPNTTLGMPASMSLT